ncbi:sigma-E factor regulatory protein RseB [Vibrio sp. UCD-FRSSP16_10]|uniref:sigma-E factor regulatory protein RseB n=1 Tax=unclassified Vibrio TaxID=2614977 RepID=UPI0007FEC464|nr:MULTISPECIES: sigma-E factor regulatory protein RseB [unclassified Vibrio]OBT17347.1 sigma-E factor regulatory protein RseB [Vibrio sp. UCD-FRSSP16_30]OBT23116.1 sigma-E factor regulatory protein RseB [Vibrio sp. UCD-FRSSP16_10]
MKKFLASACALLSLATSPLALADDSALVDENSAEALIHKMSQASDTLNYEISYVLIRKSSIEPLVYRQANDNNTLFAQLMYLSGPVREVIRRGNQVSYIEPGIDPFTIVSDKMVAPLMPMLEVNPDRLTANYDFVKVGRAREAGAPSDVVRVVPKDGQRYSYIVWIDEASSLPLRADLIDRDGEILEQYRTVSYSVTDHLVPIMKGLEQATLPDVVTLPDSSVDEISWNAGWMPKGFVSKKMQSHPLLGSDRVVESQIYSDGLFQFSIYVAPEDDLSLKRQLVRQGRRTLQSAVVHKHEVIVVGDIPPTTAQRILQSVTFH